MLKSVKDACRLRPNSLEIRVSDQVERLDELITGADGKAFFARTYLTDGMNRLIRETIGRLAGKTNNAIFHLKQAMGGGKTHLMIGVGLLATRPDLRDSICSEIPYIHSFEKAKVAAFNGRNHPEAFFWGEIASQIGKGEFFREFWSSGPKAPDERAWLKLFEGEDPILILLDELPPYFHYYNTQPSGNGTIADIVTDAFSNMLTAASKKSKVCLVISDLSAAYDTGSNLIDRALGNARQELGRQEYSITPVDMTGNEIYEILRKTLFESLPDKAIIDEIAARYGEVLADAEKSKSARRGAESLADEIAKTYPFHPQLKNLVALFKENERFKQTRGLLELASRLLKSVWNRSSNDVYLIGPQHFDLSDDEVREKIVEISAMQDVIAKDLWDHNGSAHAQIEDLNSANDSSTQVATLLLTASLSTAINAVKGLSKEELVEGLIDPIRKPSEFHSAFEKIKSSAWYLHHTPEGRFYFDRQENLTKLLQSIAVDAPFNQIEDLIRHRLEEMFVPARKVAYTRVLPLPIINTANEEIRRNRVLLIISPDSKIPPEEVRRLFDSITSKNNVLVLTGDRSEMGSVETAASHVYAGLKADDRIPSGHPQREELEQKKQQFEQGFTATILSLFDKVYYPVQRPGREAELVSKPLDPNRDPNKPFNGEEQIEKTLTSDPLKLYLDIEKAFDGIREKAENLLWPSGSDDVRWEDFRDRASEQAAMPWLPPKGLERIRELAFSRGNWEDLGHGYHTKKPRPKKTSVQISQEGDPDDKGKVTLRVNPQNGGPSPRIHYSEDGPVSQESPILGSDTLNTAALKVQFLVIDPSGKFETGDSVTWINIIRIRSELKTEGGHRRVSLYAAPRGNLKYTLDGSEPRYGTSYTGSIEIGDQACHLLAFAEEDGIYGRENFIFPASGKKELQIDLPKPAKLQGTFRLDSREKTFRGLKEAQERRISFKKVTLDIGASEKSVRVSLGNFEQSPDYIQRLLDMVLSDSNFQPTDPITMTFLIASFQSGHDLMEFSKVMDLEVKQMDVFQ